MSEKKYTEDELFEAGKNMLEGPFRFVDVFNMIKQKTGDDDELRSKIMERLKETEASKVLLDSHINKPPKKVDYAGIALGLIIIALGFVLYKAGLSTGYIFAFPIIIMCVGIYILFRSI